MKLPEVDDTFPTRANATH